MTTVIFFLYILYHDYYYDYHYDDDFFFQFKILVFQLHGHQLRMIEDERWPSIILND